MYVSNNLVKNALVVTCLVIATMVLSSCSTLSKDECVQANWELLGYTDGTRGRASSRVDQYRQDCAKHGVTPNLPSYTKGRDRGLVEFCRPNRGYDLGVGGSSYLQVCPAHLEGEFLEAYRYGSQIHDATDTVAALQVRLKDSLGAYEHIIVETENTEAELVVSRGSAVQRIALLGRLKVLADKRKTASHNIDDANNNVHNAIDNVQRLYEHSPYPNKRMPSFAIIDIVKREPNRLTLLDAVIDNEDHHDSQHNDHHDDVNHDKKITRWDSGLKDRIKTKSHRPPYSATKTATQIVRDEYNSFCHSDHKSNPVNLTRAIDKSLKDSSLSQYQCRSINMTGPLCRHGHNRKHWQTVVKCSSKIGNTRVPFGVTVGCEDENGRINCDFRNEPDLAIISRRDLPLKSNRKQHIKLQQCFKQRRGIGLTLREGDNFSDCIEKTILHSPTHRGCELLAKTSDDNPTHADMCYWQLAVSNRNLDICENIVWRNQYNACRKGKHP